jgi:manganese/zinc/iron transport system substrate-binding protein
MERTSWRLSAIAQSVGDHREPDSSGRSAVGRRSFARQASIGCIVAACWWLSAGCGQSPSEDGSSGQPGKIRVVCTTTMIADLARRIAGDDAEVVGIMRVGEDPHVYEVRPRDAQQIAAAELVLVNGLHLESTLLHVIEHNARGKVVVLAEDPRIEPLAGPQQGGGAAAAPDPHCWFNVRYFRVYAERARDAFGDVDPDHAADYRRRAEQYLKELDDLHAWVEQQVTRVARPRRVIVTSHDAFAYYGRAYGIDVHAVIGISTEQQPRPQDVVRLEQLVRDRGIRALFIETSVSKTLNDIVQRVAANTGVRIGGTLYSDSLGSPDTEAGTYLGMVRHNTRTIVEALR